jgi:hypothetical protein
VAAWDGLRNPSHAFVTGVSCESSEGFASFTDRSPLGIRSEPGGRHTIRSTSSWALNRMDTKRMLVKAKEKFEGICHDTSKYILATKFRRDFIQQLTIRLCIVYVDDVVRDKPEKINYYDV